MKERKIYKAIINNNGIITNMIVTGNNKQILKRTIIDFYKKIGQIDNIKYFNVHLVRVEFFNGNYIEIKK